MFDLDEMAPGVRGYTVDTPNGTYIPLIIADNPGNGDVGRYLDSLPTDRIWRVPNVMNRVLAGMLSRRGFTLEEKWAEQYGQMVDVWVREASHE